MYNFDTRPPPQTPTTSATIQQHPITPIARRPQTLPAAFTLTIPESRRAAAAAAAAVASAAEADGESTAAVELPVPPQSLPTQQTGAVDVHQVDDETDTADVEADALQRQLESELERSRAENERHAAKLRENIANWA